MKQNEGGLYFCWMENLPFIVDIAIEIFKIKIIIEIH